MCSHINCVHFFCPNVPFWFLQRSIQSNRIRIQNRVAPIESSMPFLSIYTHHSPSPISLCSPSSPPFQFTTNNSLHSFTHLQTWPISNPTWTVLITVPPFPRRSNHATALTAAEAAVAVSSESCGRFWLHLLSSLALQSSFSGWWFNLATSSSMSRKPT